MERNTKRYDGNNNYDSESKGDKRFMAETSLDVENVHSNSEGSDDDCVTYTEMKTQGATNSDGESAIEIEDKTVSSSDPGDKRQAEAKPSQSYIAFIAMAILSSSERKMVLSDIYRYIIENYPFYKTQDKSWRNSIRHNLSLNDCFIKAGRSMNGKGNYWAIHPSNEEDFSKGDFRRRRTRRKIKRSAYPLGLYSEYFRPYYSTASRLRSDCQGQNLWSASDARPRAKSDENYYMQTSPIRPFPQKISQRKPTKSFTIDSILGKDSKNTERNSQKNKAFVHRRHFSWTSSPVNWSNSPPLEGYGPSHSTVYSHFTFEPTSPYPVSPEAYRRADTHPVISPYLADTIRDFSRLRTFSLR